LHYLEYGYARDIPVPESDGVPVFRNDLMARVSREMQRPLSPKERAAIGGYLPDGMDPDDISALFRLFREGDGSRGGRRTSGASFEPPKWWAFYVERAVRAAWGKAAELIRLGIGLRRPLPETAVADYVRRVIADEAVPECGANGYLCARGAAGYEIFTVWAGDASTSGLLSDLTEEQADAVTEGRSPDYLALLYLANGVPEDSRQRLGATGAEFVAFMLSDTIPDWPWMVWSPARGNYYADNLTLHIASIAAAPDQVLALYEEARRGIVEHWGAEGRPVPIALSSERMDLVRFVEQEAGAGPYDWTALLTAWKRIGGDYATPAAMKAAFYQSSMPVKRYRAKTRKDG
jgi:hypothetical protein